MQLEVTNLTINYDGIAALQNLSIFVGAGEIVTVLGANGAGKSTLTRALIGLQPFNNGTIRLSDQDVTGLSCKQMVEKGVSLVPETREIFPHLTVKQNLQLGGLLKSKACYKDNLDKVCVLFPRLLERKNQMAGTLSGGEQQMLAIGRALMQEPRLLILDEPSLGLAPNLADFIFEKILAINKTGTTIILVEQKTTLALGISNRGYVLSLGQVMKEGTGKELLQDREIWELYMGGARN